MPPKQTFTLPDPEIWTHPETWGYVPEAIGNVAFLGIELRSQSKASEAFSVLLDPNNTLPEVTLKADPQRSWLENGIWQGYDIYNPEGEQVGYVNLAFDHTDSKAFISEIVLGKDIHGDPLRDTHGRVKSPNDTSGKGFGLGTYKKIIPEVLRQGYGFKSYPKRWGRGLSKGGYRMWQQLEKAGVARITEQGEINEDSENPFNYATMRLEILSPEELIAAAQKLQPSPES